MTCLMERLRGNLEVDWIIDSYLTNKKPMHPAFEMLWDKIRIRYRQLRESSVTNAELASRP
jgi:hypothetical protein